MARNIDTENSMEAGAASRGENQSFGAALRSIRLAKGIGLRQFARRIGISPTYLSQVERGDTAPPVEDRVTAMARELDQDVDELLALAGRIPAAVRSAIMRYPAEMTALVQAAGQLSRDDLKELIRQAEKMA